MNEIEKLQQENEVFLRQIETNKRKLHELYIIQLKRENKLLIGKCFQYGDDYTCVTDIDDEGVPICTSFRMINGMIIVDIKDRFFHNEYKEITYLEFLRALAALCIKAREVSNLLWDYLRR